MNGKGKLGKQVAAGNRRVTNGVFEFIFLWIHMFIIICQLMLYEFIFSYEFICMSSFFDLWMLLLLVYCQEEWKYVINTFQGVSPVIFRQFFVKQYPLFLSTFLWQKSIFAPERDWYNNPLAIFTPLPSIIRMSTMAKWGISVAK